MAETYGPFDAPAGDPRNWTQASWYDFAPTWAPSGVIGTFASSYTTGALPLVVNGSAVSLGAGKAWVRGAGYKNDAVKPLTAPDGSAVPLNTNASLSRRDRVVIRRDVTAKTVTAVRLAGTPAQTPQTPALQQNDAGQWDLPLHSFLVPPNSGTTLTGFDDERVWLNTDWLNLTITNPATVLGSASCQVLDGVCYFNVGAKAPDGGQWAAGFQVTKFPDGIHPPVDWYASGLYSGSQGVQVTIGLDGSAKVTTGTTTTGASLTFSGSFPVG